MVDDVARVVVRDTGRERWWRLCLGKRAEASAKSMVAAVEREDVWQE